MSLSLRVRHRFPRFSLDVEFTAPTPGATVLFGPSGAGKSSVVAATAGLLRADEVEVAVNGVVLSGLPPERRRIGLVFQDARLFPHLSVRSNLRYGLRRAPPGSLAEADVVALLGIGDLLDRRPHTLSGGEKQRVAIGRALLAQPRLLIMDEPLASLDGPRKAEILPYLLRLKALGVPILYVTHSSEEVARLADTLVLLDGGRSVAAGSIGELASRADLPLAARDDAGAVLDARVAAHDTARRLSLLHAAGREIWIPLLPALSPGSPLRVRIPAREVILASERPAGISVHNIIPGAVRQIGADPARHAALVEVALDGPAGLLARVTPDAVEKLGLAPGRPVLALVKSVAVEVLL
jgi:molybdate transport system ATP-binding protein